MLLLAGSASAQWMNTKHHLVLTAHAGGSMGFTSSSNTAFYQLSGGAMYYKKRRLALGGELGYSQIFGQYSNLDVLNLNGFAHLKLPLGLYGQGGLGLAGTVSDGRSAMPTNAGLYWAAGWAKSLGPKLALDVQYRHAPSLGMNDAKNYQSGLRLGLMVKI